MNSFSAFCKRSVDMMAQRIPVLMGVSVMVLLLSLPASAQLNLGRILGSISDQSGAVIAGATVTVVDVPRGVARTLTTDSAGGYTAPSLVPSTYTVRAEFKGFKTLERQNVEVGVGQEVRLDLTLQPGDQAQTVTVTEAIPIIDTTNAVLSSTLQTETISELPINGRLFTKLLDFQPGVHGNPGGNSPNYETNGASGQGNYYLLDGVENSNIFVNSGPLIGAATSTDELTILPQDAVQEVNVMTNPPAEFGWFQGAVVNVGLKSGTNNIHGTAYGFFRNASLDAYDPYLATGAPKQRDDFKQFGGSFGGPIKKDKLFYFGSYDGMRYDVGTASTATVPTVNSGVANANSVPFEIADLINNHSISPSPLSLALSDCTVSGTAPNASATCGTKGVFRNDSLVTNGLGVPGDSFGHSDNGFGKIDYHPNDLNSINGEYFFGQAVTTTPNVGAPSFWDNLNVSRTQMMRAVWTYAPNSKWVNDVRFGYNRYNLADGNAECVNGDYSTGNVGQPNYKGLGFISGATPPSPFCGFPAVNFNQSGYPSFGALSFFISDQGVFQNTYTVYDNVSYTRGTHNFKFGFEFHHSKFRGIGAPGYLDGVLNFNGGGAFATNPVGDPNCTNRADCSSDLQDFLAGALGGSNQILVNPQQELTSLGFNREALYFTDNFRLNSRVTVNLGLRYELEPAILVDNNSAGNFDPSSQTGMVQQNGSPLYKADHKAFAPRIGFAWDITGKGTTVLRAGFGMSYDTPQVDDLIAQGFGAGLNSIPTGFALYNDTGLAIPASTNPQAVKTAVVSIPGAALSWAPNVPVFPANLNADLACGTGIQIPATQLADGSFPGPCTLKARGTVVKLANGQLSMDTSQRRSPMYTWTLGVQHAIGSSASLTVNYVGTHASDLSSEINVNQAAPGATVPCPLIPDSSDGTVAGCIQHRQPYYSQFPWFNGIFVYGPAGFSNYNALQAIFVLRSFHGLTLNAGYTFSRDLATPKGGNNPYITNALCVACDYGLQSPTQDLGVTLVYAFPSLKVPAQLLEGWQISSTINLQSGMPFNGLDNSDDFAGVGNGRNLFGGNGEPWSLYGKGTDFNGIGKLAGAPCYGFGFPGCNSTIPQACIAAATAEPVNAAMNALNAGSSSGLASLLATGCYMSANGKSVIVPPAQGTFGNMAPGALIGPAFHEWDLSLHKTFKIRENISIEGSVSAFNVVNSRSYAQGFTGNIVNLPFLFGVSTSQPNDGNPVNGTGGARQLLLGVKMSF